MGSLDSLVRCWPGHGLGHMRKAELPSTLCDALNIGARSGWSSDHSAQIHHRREYSEGKGLAQIICSAENSGFPTPRPLQVPQTCLLLCQPSSLQTGLSLLRAHSPAALSPCPSPLLPIPDFSDQNSLPSSLLSVKSEIRWPLLLISLLFCPLPPRIICTTQIQQHLPTVYTMS